MKIYIGEEITRDTKPNLSYYGGAYFDSFTDLFIYHSVIGDFIFNGLPIKKYVALTVYITKEGNPLISDQIRFPKSQIFIPNLKLLKLLNNSDTLDLGLQILFKQVQNKL